MLQLIVLVVYFLVLIGIGVWSRSKVHSRDGFFVAGRRGTTPLITGSLLATIVGGSVTVGMAGLGFGRGLTGAWWLLVGAVGLLILALFLAERVRRTALYTLPELIERQYGRRVALAASILIVIAWTGVVAGQIVAAGKVLSVLGLGSAASWMLIFTVVFLLYATLGGQFSIIFTDVSQSAMLFAGIFIALGLVFLQVGGLGGLRASLPAAYFSFPLSSEFGGKDFLSLLILVGATYVVGPDIYTRLFCATEARTARKSAFLSAFLLIPLAFAIVLLGMGARVLYPAISAEQAFPQLISGVLSPALGALILAALVAALMSSADTCLLGQSVILTEDIIKQFYPALDERKSVLLTRLSIVILGLTALGLALALKGVISSLLFAYTVFTCGLVVPVLAGFYRDSLKVTPQGALAALIGGGVIGLVGKIPGFSIPFKEDFGLLGFAVSAILLFGVSFINRRRQQRRYML